jgi:hypothetical protein
MTGDLRHSAEVLMICAFGHARPPCINSGLTGPAAYRAPVLDFNRTQPPAMVSHGTGKMCHRGQGLLWDLATRTAHGSALRSSNMSLRSLLATDAVPICTCVRAAAIARRSLTASRATEPRHDEDELLDTVCARMSSRSHTVHGLDAAFVSGERRSAEKTGCRASPGGPCRRPDPRSRSSRHDPPRS